MVEKSQDIEMDKSVAVGNVENNSEKYLPLEVIIFLKFHKDWAKIVDFLSMANLWASVIFLISL